MCDLLRAVAARGLVGPVTLVLDNARYQRNAIVMGLAPELGIELLFLPSYSPNLNLIERLWRFTKRKAAYGHYHPTFADFRAAVEDVLDRVPTTHAEKLSSLMTLSVYRAACVGRMIYIGSVVALYGLQLLAIRLESGACMRALFLAGAVFHSVEYLAVCNWSVQKK